MERAATRPSSVIGCSIASGTVILAACLATVGALAPGAVASSPNYGPNSCKLLAKSTVSKAIGKTVSGASDVRQGSAYFGWFGNECTYSVPRGRGLVGGVTVLVVATGVNKYFNLVKSEPFKFQKVSGLGEQATYYPSEYSLFVLAGAYGFNVEAAQSLGVTLKQEVSLAKDILVAL